MGYLLYSLSFDDELVSHFDAGVQQAFQQVSRADAHQIGCLIHTSTHNTHTHLISSVIED